VKRKVWFDPTKGDKMLAEECPCCGEPLIETYFWNPDIFGTEDNPRIIVCRNEECKGWFCECCDSWHPYKTGCSVAEVRNVRSGTNYPTNYDEWKRRSIGRNGKRGIK